MICGTKPSTAPTPGDDAVHDEVVEPANAPDGLKSGADEHGDAGNPDTVGARILGRGHADTLGDDLAGLPIGGFAVEAVDDGLGRSLATLGGDLLVTSIGKGQRLFLARFAVVHEVVGLHGGLLVDGGVLGHEAGAGDVLLERGECRLELEGFEVGFLIGFLADERRYLVGVDARLASLRQVLADGGLRLVVGLGRSIEGRLRRTLG